MVGHYRHSIKELAILYRTVHRKTDTYMFRDRATPPERLLRPIRATHR